MKAAEEKELEQLLQRELRDAPDLPAPETLLHRVMLEVHARERRPWWARHWAAWPGAVQVLSLCLLLACAASVSWLMATAVDALSLQWVSASLSEWLKPVIPVWEAVCTLGRVGLRILDAGGYALLMMAGLGLFGFYLFSIALGTACVRMAMSRT